MAVVAALVFVCWAATIGRYGGPDEPAHVVRAYAVAHGQLRGDPVPGLAPGYRAVSVPATLGTGDPACYRLDPAITSTCAAADPDAAPFVRVATSAGTNPPWYYLAVGLLPRLVGVDDDPLAYRISAIALVALAVGATATRLRLDPGRAALLVAAVSPSCWFLWGVVNPNALEIALVALAATGLTRRSTGRALLWTSVPLALAVAMRPIALAWAVTVLVVFELAVFELAVFERVGRTRSSWRMRPRDRVVLWSPVVAAVLSVVIWSAWSGLVVDDDRTARSGSLSTAVGDSLGGMPRTALELVASMGWLEFWAPWPAVAAWCAAVAILAVAVVATGRRRARSTSGGPTSVGPESGLPVSGWLVLAASALVVPVVFEVVLYERVGPIWQGRYLLPVLAIAVVAAVGATPPIGVGRARALVAATAVATIATHWAVARRYSVGTDGSWWLHDGDYASRWLTPGWWVVVHGAGVVLLAAVWWRAYARDERGRVEPADGQTM